MPIPTKRPGKRTCKCKERGTKRSKTKEKDTTADPGRPLSFEFDDDEVFLLSKMMAPIVTMTDLLQGRKFKPLRATKASAFMKEAMELVKCLEEISARRKERKYVEAGGGGDGDQLVIIADALHAKIELLRLQAAGDERGAAALEHVKQYVCAKRLVDHHKKKAIKIFDEVGHDEWW